jgi:DNA repair exonuclease SbcCD ATPase subunit
VSKFRNSLNNKLVTVGLFLEHTNDIRNGFAIYTLKDQDHRIGDRFYLALKPKYLELEDITEYEFATTYFENWTHWERILNVPELRKHIDQWRKELELKIKAKALKRLMKEAAEGGKEATSINKFLVQRGYVDKDTKGRPSKQAIKEEAERLASLEQSLNEDLARISLDQVN